MSFFKSKENLTADLSSEIFRSLAASELAHKNASIKTVEELENEKALAIEAFEEFQKKVNASAKLKKTFKTLQTQFLTNAELVEKTDQGFVDAVLLLDIEE